MKNNYFTKSRNKFEVCLMLEISRTTLQQYLNVQFFEDLQKFGYKKNQKHLNPAQLNFLVDKIGLSKD